MCNLYSMTRNQEAIRRLFTVTRDNAGNMPPLPAIFPDKSAPVIHMSNSERALSMMRWGMPGPAQFGGAPITNIRNTASPHWRRWLGPANRCLVPVTSFSEYAPEKNPTTGRKDIVWFALNKNRPMFAFAGIWTNWTGVRGTKANPVEGEHLLYGFLTTEPNEVVRPIHAKAMPVILHQDDWDAWLTEDARIALKLQRPWPDDGLQIVKRGPDKSDEEQADDGASAQGIQGGLPF